MEKWKFLFFIAGFFAAGFGYRSHFLKNLEITYESIFFPADRIILSRLKKIKKNIEISKIVFFGSGFEYRWEVGPFS